MLIGKDFDKIHVTFFNVDISEPNVLLSDVFMSLVSLYCGWRLLKIKGNRSFQKWWIRFFFIFGLSSLAGGIGHALFSYFGNNGKLLTWFTAVLSIFFIEKAMTYSFKNKLFRKRLHSFSFIKLTFVYTILLGILWFFPLNKKPDLPFLPVAINTIVGVSWFAGYYSYQLSKKLNANFRFIFLGVLIMLPSSFLFLCKINLHPWFDKNDFSHLLISIGIYFFMIGIEKISKDQHAFIPY